MIVYMVKGKDRRWLSKSGTPTDDYSKVFITNTENLADKFYMEHDGGCYTKFSVEVFSKTLIP